MSCRRDPGTARGRAAGLAPYPEVLEVVHRDLVAENVEESILEHAAMAVPSNRARQYLGPRLRKQERQVHTTELQAGYTYERTNRSLFSQSGFLGLNFMNWLKRT